MPRAIAVGLLLAIDPIIDMGRTALNVSGSITAGTLTARDLMAAVKEGGGQATIKTVQGTPLTVTSRGKKVYVTDASQTGVHHRKVDPARVSELQKRLAALLVEHDVGVRVSRTIAVKRVDEDFFADD